MIRDGRDREKQLRNMTTFLNDVGRVYNNVSKELGKVISLSNHNFLKTDPDSRWSVWWPALLSAVQRVSIDHESLSELLVKDLVAASSRLCEEQGSLVKNLQSEGTRLIKTLRECQSQLEQRTREWDFSREKLDVAVEKSAAAAATLRATSQTTLCISSISRIWRRA
ncbi:unnamed protein product [Sphagnum jensenii]|uniref:Uncharacterized protein n=1 Tax=Sphagnum jensenii TaxID=128206 RepID=A0ABP0V9E0_9BRYO